MGLSIEGLPERAATGDVVSITVTPLDGVGRALEGRECTVESTNVSVLQVVGVDTLRALEEGSARIVARCEGAESSQTLLVTPPAVASLVITTPTQELRAGDEVTMQASVLDHSGNALDASSIVWASSDPAVALVSRDGELIAQGAGSTTIFATIEGQTTTLDVEVLPDPAATPKTAIEAPTGQGQVDEVGVGSQVDEAERSKPAATPVPRPKIARPAPKPRWRLSRARALWLAGGVATVIGGAVWAYPRLVTPSNQGELGLGPTTDATASLAVTLGGEPVDTGLALQAGESIDLDAELLDAQGQPVTATVEWSSSDPSIVQVDDVGLLTAIAAGNVTLTALANGVQLAVSVAVAELQPPEGGEERLVISYAATGRAAPGALQIPVGQSVSLGAEVQDESGGVIPRPVAWASSDPSVVSVDANGLVRAVSGGFASVSIGSGDLSETINVTVPNPIVRVAVADVSIRRADNGGAVADGLQLEVGSSVLLSPQALESGGGTLSGIQITWASSDASVASIAADGVLRGVGAGAARISASAEGATRGFTVDVVAPAPGTLVVTIRPWAYVLVNGEQQGEDHRRFEMPLAPGEYILRLENPAMSVRHDGNDPIGADHNGR